MKILLTGRDGQVGWELERMLQPLGSVVATSRAALDLCTGIPPEQKIHFECPKVGHYGVFNGSRFRTEIAPRMAKFMRAHDPCAASDLTIAQLEHMATMPLGATVRLDGGAKTLEVTEPAVAGQP